MTVRHCFPATIAPSSSMWRSTCTAVSGIFRISNRIGRAVIKPIAALMSVDQVQRLLAAAGSNSQIYRAGSITSEVLLDLFEKTADLREATKEAWHGFMTSALRRYTQQGKPYGSSTGPLRLGRGWDVARAARRGSLKPSHSRQLCLTALPLK